MMMLSIKTPGRLYLESKWWLVYWPLSSSWDCLYRPGCLRHDGLPSYYKLKEAFDQRTDSCLVLQNGGHDVARLREWWRKQMPYFPRSYESIKIKLMRLSCNFTLATHKNQQFSIELANKGITVLSWAEPMNNQMNHCAIVWLSISGW